MVVLNEPYKFWQGQYLKIKYQREELWKYAEM